MKLVPIAKGSHLPCLSGRRDIRLPVDTHQSPCWPPGTIYFKVHISLSLFPSLPSSQIPICFLYKGKDFPCPLSLFLSLPPFLPSPCYSLLLAILLPPIFSPIPLFPSPDYVQSFSFSLCSLHTMEQSSQQSLNCTASHTLRYKQHCFRPFSKDVCFLPLRAVESRLLSSPQTPFRHATGLSSFSPHHSY